MPKTATSKRTGRPPSGADGARVSEYPQLTVRIPPATRDMLHAVSVMHRTPAWQLVDQALLALFEKLPAHERKLLKSFAAHWTA